MPDYFDIVVGAAGPTDVVVGSLDPVLVPAVPVVVIADISLAGPPGPPGPPGPGSVPLTYALTVASNWTHAHGLGYDPDVQLVTADGERVYMDATYPDAGSVNLSFPSPFTGTVTLR